MLHTSRPTHPTAFAILIACLWVVFSVLPALAQDRALISTPETTTLFYYASGERVPLTVSPDFLAVQFAPPLASAIGTAPTAATLEAVAVREATALTTLATAFPTADLSTASQPGLTAGYRFYLMPLAGVSDGAAALALIDSMRTSEALSAYWVNPVFLYDEVKMILTDELLVGFPEGTPRAVVDAYNDANGVEFVRELSPDVYVLRVLPRAGVDTLMMANFYETDGVALYGSPNFVQLLPPLNGRAERAPEGGRAPLAPNDAAPTPHTQAVPPNFVPNDTYASWNWHINNTAQAQYPGATTDADIDGYEAWDTAQGVNTVIIAVIDDGVQTNHPDLDAKIVFPYDAVTGDLDPSPYDDALTRSEDAHGTHVAGVAAAETNNGAGTMGVCPSCRIMPIRIFKTTSEGLFTSDAIIADAINWAFNNGASILNISWERELPNTAITNAFKNVIFNGRGGLGGVVVFSAGNNYGSPIRYPANLAAIFPGILTVGASTWCDTIKRDTYFEPPANYDCSGEYWWGNNWGTEVNITAPGHSLTSPDLTGTDGYSGWHPGGSVPSHDYTQFNGTSGAAPVVAGVAGLVMSQNPTWTNDQIRDRIVTTTDAIHTAGFDIASGWGRVNAQKALNATVTNTGTPNDHLSNALSITTLPHSSTHTVAGAFVDRTDPAMACLTNAQTIASSLWFKFTPRYTMSATISTVGSNYDTVLGVYNGALASLGCSDQFSEDTSQVTLNLTGGVTYNILVGAYSALFNPGGLNAAASLTLAITTTTPVPPLTMTGQVTLQGRAPAPNAAWAVPLQVRIKSVASGTIVYNGTATTNTSGAYTINLSPGNYQVWVKHNHSLANLVNVNLSSNQVAIIGALREGDTDNNNIVNILDFSLLAASFGKTSAQGGYNGAADFNGDNIVNINDFSLLATNFGQTGAAIP